MALRTRLLYGKVVRASQAANNWDAGEVTRRYKVLFPGVVKRAAELRTRFVLATMRLAGLEHLTTLGTPKNLAIETQRRNRRWLRGKGFATALFRA